ncbi:MAG: restriction endonuclease subunit S [Clostridia bacterium]|nr:restriction endonuclease subunit S [Clostridia bacterium]
MRDWKMTTIAECSTILGDGLHGTPKYDENGEYAFINGNNLHNGRIVIKPDTKRVGLSEYEKHKKELTDRTVLVSINGTLGNVAVYNGEKVILGKSACYFNVSSDCDVQFMRYVASSPCFQQYINSVATGTTIKNVSLKQMREYSFLIPELEEQQRIAKVLHLLDQKIDNNQKINDNLQQQLEALYRGTIKSSTSECHSVTLDEWCHIFTGKKNANQFDENGQYVFFTCGEKPLRINSYVYDGPAIIISGNGSYTGRTLFYNGKFDLYQRTYACTLKEAMPADFIFGLFAILKIELHTKIAGGTHGSSIPYIVMNDLAKFEFPFNRAEFADFSEKAKTLLTTIQHNQQQNEALAQVRDALLPKLMSGEIDVSNINF